MRKVNRHAYGPLQTKGREFHKTCSKNVRDRIKRWAKRVIRHLDSVESDHEQSCDR